MLCSLTAHRRPIPRNRERPARDLAPRVRGAKSQDLSWRVSCARVPARCVPRELTELGRSFDGGRRVRMSFHLRGSAPSRSLRPERAPTLPRFRCRRRGTRGKCSTVPRPRSASSATVFDDARRQRCRARELVIVSLVHCMADLNHRQLSGKRAVRDQILAPERDHRAIDDRAARRALSPGPKWRAQEKRRRVRPRMKASARLVTSAGWLLGIGGRVLRVLLAARWRQVTGRP